MGVEREQDGFNAASDNVSEVVDYVAGICSSKMRR